MKSMVDSGAASLALPERLEGDGLVLFKNATRKVLGDDAVRELVLDFDSVEYVDSMALGALLLLREKALERGLGLALTRLRPRVRRLFTLANLHRIFDIR